MTPASIKDDFLNHTLAEIPGILGKLAYLAELREEGKYIHWGLARIYGEEAIQQPLAEIHRNLFLQILRMPMRGLAEDVGITAAGKQLTPGQFVESLVQNSASLLPPQIGGGSVDHFNSIVAALSLLFAQPRSQERAHGANQPGG